MLKIWLDMDNTLFDFTGAAKEDIYNPPCMYKEGFFEGLNPFPGAREFVQILYQMSGVEVGIATKPCNQSLISYTEKANSIAKHFPFLLNSLVMIQNKAILPGDILVDDDPAYNGFNGKMIVFNPKSDSIEQYKNIINIVKKTISDRETFFNSTSVEL